MGVSKSDHAKGRRIEATVRGQTVNLTAKQTSRVTVRLSDALVDLDLAVTVKYNGKVKFRGNVDRLKSRMSESLAVRADSSSAAYATITVGKDSSVRVNGRLAEDRFLKEGKYRAVLFADDSTSELVSSEFEVSPRKPTLNALRNKDGTLTFTFEGNLERAPTLLGPWRKVKSKSPYTLHPVDGIGFFRAVQ